MTETTTTKKTNWLFWIFAGIGGLGILAVIFIAIMISEFSSGGGGRTEQSPLAIADGEIEYRLGNVVDLRGNDLSAITIESGDWNRGRGISSIKGYEQYTTHNIVFFNRETSQSRKLLRDNNGVVVAAAFLPDQETGIPLSIGDKMDGATNIAEATAMAAMAADGIETTDQRNQYSRKLPLKHYLAITARPSGETSKTNLLVGRLSDGKQISTMEGIESIERFWILSPIEVGLIVQERGEVFHRGTNFQTLSITKSTKIAFD